MSITDAAGVNSYPIASYSYVQLYQHQANRAAGEALLSFLRWVLHDGQKDVVQMNYAPLPAQLVRREQEQLQDVRLPPAD
jgi:phosphate transport system substrate-binding protein